MGSMGSSPRAREVYTRMVTVVARSLWIASFALLALMLAPVRAQVPSNDLTTKRMAMSTSRVSGTYTVGNFLVRITANTGTRSTLSVAHKAEPTRLLWESLPDTAFVAAAQGHAAVTELGIPEGLFDIQDRISRQCDQQSLDTAKQEGAELVLRGTLSSQGCKADYRLIFTPVSANQLKFTLHLDGPGTQDLNRLYLRSASSADEQFFGFGEQLTYFNQKGHVLPILVQEHGVGRGRPLVTPIYDLMQNRGGNPYATDAPAPHYISTKLRSLFLENKEYSVFDLRYADRVEIKLFANVMTGRIVYGKTPLDLIEGYTAYAGRMRVLPDWIHQGVIVGLQGGTDRVRQKLAELDQANVPLAGLWIQDWAGRRVTSAGSQLWWNWRLDETYYPDWTELVATLARRNVRMLTYINPFLTNTSGHDQLFRAAEKAGYLVKKPDGTPQLIRNSNFYAGLIDLSNPGARDWIKAIIKKELIGHAGASGWMADFGEALPLRLGTLRRCEPRDLAQSLP